MAISGFTSHPYEEEHKGRSAHMGRNDKGGRRPCFFVACKCQDTPFSLGGKMKIIEKEVSGNFYLRDVSCDELDACHIHACGLE